MTFDDYLKRAAELRREADALMAERRASDARAGEQDHAVVAVVFGAYALGAVLLGLLS